MKVAHLTIGHDVFDTRIFVKECVSLRRAGFDVVYIVPHVEEEIHDGVQIRAIPTRQGRLQRFLRSSWDIFRAAMREQADVFHFHDLPLVPVGILLKLAGKIVIYDAHELTIAQIQQKTYLPGWTRRIGGLLVSFTEIASAKLFFDGIVGAVPTISEQFPQHKTITLCNFPRQSEIFAKTDHLFAERDPNIVYIGGISETRGVRTMLAALNSLPDESDIRLKLAGHFYPPALEFELARMPGWERVDYLGWLDRDQINNLLNSSRVGIFVADEMSPNIQISYPIKIFEYMAAGIPIICSNIPLWRELVVEHGCGLAVSSNNISELTVAIQALVNNPARAQAMGQRGRKAVAERYNWETEQHKLIEFYKQITHFDPPLHLEWERDEGKS